MRLRLFLLLLLSLYGFDASAQHDTARISRNEFSKLNYENDYFTGTDIYYTQGIKLELVFPFLRYSPIMFLLPHLSNSTVQYGINFDQDCFTPTSITVDSIQKGDRPYSGYIYLGHVKTSAQEDKKQKMEAEADVGTLGKCAVCEQEQKMIHRWINDRQPDGWKYQTASEVMVNYRLKYEKGILNDTSIDIRGYGQVEAGNIYDNAIIGGTLRLGKMQSYFAGDRTRKLQLYAFLDGWAEGIGYNATLQGGLFSTGNPYTLSYNTIDHFVLGYTYGICLSYKSVSLEYSSTHITHEILNGLYHGWGHIGIAGYF